MPWRYFTIQRKKKRYLRNTAPPPRLIFLCPISASSFIRGAYLRASLQSRFHKITLAHSSKITSKWSSAEGYRGRERTDWNSYCVCTRVCVWTCVRKSDYFSRMTDQNDRKRRQRKINVNLHERSNRHSTKHWPSLCSLHEKFAPTFVIRKGTQFDPRHKWPYVSHVVE